MREKPTKRTPMTWTKHNNILFFSLKRRDQHNTKQKENRINKLFYTLHDVSLLSCIPSLRTLRSLRCALVLALLAHAPLIVLRMLLINSYVCLHTCSCILSLWLLMLPVQLCLVQGKHVQVHGLQSWWPLPESRAMDRNTRGSEQEMLFVVIALNYHGNKLSPMGIVDAFALSFCCQTHFVCFVCSRCVRCLFLYGNGPCARACRMLIYRVFLCCCVVWFRNVGSLCCWSQGRFSFGVVGQPESKWIYQQSSTPL